MTKIFCDIADLEQIRKFDKKKIVKGFTTNPSLFRKAGAKNYIDYCKKILKVTKKPISFEVFADSADDMISQANTIIKLGKNVYVKVPVVNSQGKFMGKVIKYLSDNNININITAVYSSKQVKSILNKINKKSNVIISVFVGRAADSGKDPIPNLYKIIKLSKSYNKVKILWASVREPYNYLQSKKVGCHLITIPPKIIEKIENFGKTNNQLTSETVKKFLHDSKKSKFKI